MIIKISIKTISIFAVAIMLVVSINARADTIIERLAGISEKTWQVEAFDINLGTSSKCTKGLQYIFNVDGTLAIRSCMNSEVKINQYPFRIEDDGIDNFISYAGQKYRLIYSRRINDLGLEEEELVIRKDGSKQIATMDIIMVHIL